MDKVSRLECCLDWSNWNIGFYIIDSPIGKILKMSVLPFCLIVRIGGE